MRIMCVQDFGSHKVGEIAVVPDGSEVAPGWFRPLTDEENAKLDAPPPEEATSEPDQADEAGTDKKKGKG